MMASRQNKEAREGPSYGAPLDTPKPSPDREAERKRKLETEPTAEERRERIEEQEQGGIEESAKRRRERQNRRTEAPKPIPYTRVGETTGKTPAEILAERGEDVNRAIDVAEGVAPTEEPAVVAAPIAKRRPVRERDQPKQ
jgi:hypothetical protein